MSYPYGPPPGPPALPPPPYQPVPQFIHPKNPAAAIVLSFFLPGVGSMYAGNTRTGIWILVGWIAGLILAFAFIGIPVIIGFWVWGMVNGYHSAVNWNTARGIQS